MRQLLKKAFEFILKFRMNKQNNDSVNNTLKGNVVMSHLKIFTDQLCREWYSYLFHQSK